MYSLPSKRRPWRFPMTAGLAFSYGSVDMDSPRAFRLWTCTRVSSCTPVATERLAPPSHAEPRRRPFPNHQSPTRSLAQPPANAVLSTDDSTDAPRLARHAAAASELCTMCPAGAVPAARTTSHRAVAQSLGPRRVCSAPALRSPSELDVLQRVPPLNLSAFSPTVSPTVGLLLDVRGR